MLYYAEKGNIKKSNIVECPFVFYFRALGNISGE